MAYFEYQPRTSIFHYTTEFGFRGIIQSKSLWLSDITSSNDPREIQLGYDMLAVGMRSVRQADVPGITIREMLGFLENVRDLSKRGKFFICCFSTVKDALPLWREYSAGGTGLSIGFRPTAMHGMQGRVQQAQYQGDDTEIRFRSVAIEALRRMGQPRTLQRVLAVVEAASAATCLKHRSWKYEREIRLLMHQHNAKPDISEPAAKYIGQHPDGKLVEWREPLRREARGLSISYLECPFGRYSEGKIDGRRAIASVYRGPCCVIPREEISDLLSSNGFEGVSIIDSECAVK
jgi:hypothetical protein